MIGTLEERFWPKVQICEHGLMCDICCWEWIGCREVGGYGRIRIKYKWHKAHRIAWSLHHRQEIPDGLLVCHECDNPPCVSFHHLWLGTDKDNMDDCISKGRKAILIGSDHPLAYLSEWQIKRIRYLFAVKGWTRYELAEAFCTIHSNIVKILKRETWKHLPDDGYQEIINSKPRSTGKSKRKKARDTFY